MGVMMIEMIQGILCGEGEMRLQIGVCDFEECVILSTGFEWDKGDRVRDCSIVENDEVVWKG